MRYAFLLLLSVVISCSGIEQASVDGDAPPQLVLTQGSFSSLPGWRADSLRDIEKAFTKSCSRIAKRAPKAAMGSLAQAGTAGDWQPLCRTFMATDNSELRAFFESNFTPYQLSDDGDGDGLFTGYYEASLNGSRTKTARYNIPLHKRPDDLVMVQLGNFRDDLKGRRIAGRVRNGKLTPYESREDIVRGDWPHEDEVLVWVDNAVDAFFLQIQGSGVITLADGGKMRVGYDGQNGHPYYAIGRELIKRGTLTKETVSLQTIRAWLAANPAQADEIMNTNASYVFFRELKTDGPVGGEGVTLTKLRSLAVDHSLLSYGVPMWVDIAPPATNMPRLQRLMIAQDTGGAIRGVVRGDVFWGHGQRAEDMAGVMKSQGQAWVLLPKTLTKKR